MNAVEKTLQEIWSDEGKKMPTLSGWKLKALVSEDCLSYLAWNEESKEALLIDPKHEEKAHYLSWAKSLQDYTWIAVIDTHTHADHVSLASELSQEMKAPMVMHGLSPSTRVDLRIAKRTHLASRASPVILIPTPGHTPDGITVVWGPFAFTGDTVFFADVGRDDLPGGDPSAHYESLQILKAVLSPESILLPGHDFKGGRASSWETQLKINSSLTQGREEFISEAAAYQAPAPKDFKRSLFENLK